MNRQQECPQSTKSQDHGAQGGPAGHVEEAGAARHQHAREERGEEGLQRVRRHPGKVGVRPQDLEDVVVGLEDGLPLDVEDQLRVEGDLRVGRPLRVGGVLVVGGALYIYSYMEKVLWP